MAPGDLVPGDHPIGISDDGRSHSGIPYAIIGLKFGKRDVGLPARRWAAKLRRDLAHEQGEAIGRRLVRHRTQAERRYYAADAKCRDFGNRLGDPAR
jgi:hypothetical protein